MDPGLALRIDHYVALAPIASGGMATVYFGKSVRPGGFRKTVAIKRLHPHLANEQEFVDMLLDEARLASRIAHTHVVCVLDVVQARREVLLVMEYVHGLSLSMLLRASAKDRVGGELLTSGVAAGVAVAMLGGLQAAHEATESDGTPLGIIHRDVSPQNVLVGADGITKVVDFGIAKAMGRLQTTRQGVLKGKLGYVAPEQATDVEVDRRIDVYAAGIVLWEMLTRRRLFVAKSDYEAMATLSTRRAPPPSEIRRGISRALDEVVLRALSPDPNARFATAAEMALAVERAEPLASPRAIAEWVQQAGRDPLEKLTALRAEVDACETESVPIAVEDHPSRGPANPRPSLPASAPTVRLGANPDPLQEGAALGTPHDPAPVLVTSVGEELRRPARRLLVRAAMLLAGVAAAGVIALRAFAPIQLASAGPAQETATPPPALPAAEQLIVVAAPPHAAGPHAAGIADRGDAESPALGAQSALESDAGASSASRSDRDGARRTTPASRKPNCNPPYVVDARGIRRYRVECM